ncbi:hypothetical protein ACPPVW_16915 [Leifsonia sp. McL0607]|uniref:PH-like domain-containing protein n=1 Tax=Leifsonia sp. McL0607 TaxID=3415672 RepID=UPI003CEC223A
MDKLLPTIGILLVVIVVLALALVGWRRRVRRDAPAGGGYPAPETATTATASSEVLYVATTAAGEPLERLALPGLTYRGRGTVEVSADGVQLRVAGEQPVFIPAASLTGVGASTVAIDRVVERDGMVRLGWTTSGGAAADSYFRVVDPAGRGPLTAAVEDIIPAASTPGDSTEREV